MENVTVKKDALLDVLRENRAQHRTIFEEALAGWETEVQKVLASHVDKIRNGKKYHVIVNLPQPEDHTRDYDRAIQMVEMDINDTVVLSEYDFQQYVMDDWSWKRNFLASNAQYSSTATQLLES